jgi:carboxynorspermidine decarboxylase
MAINYDHVPSPAFVLEEALLRKNLELMRYVQEASGASIILALKGFSMWHVFPLVGQYLKGATASSLFEARLIREEMGVKAHTYAPAYKNERFKELLTYSSHLTFNSLSQLNRFLPDIQASPEKVSVGLRVNPEYSDVTTEMYNPCAAGSRLGILDTDLAGGLPEVVEGLHFHTLCESSALALEKTLESFEARFGKYLGQLKWVNFGGGHLMTREGYEVEHLIRIIRDFKARYDLEVILEPGSAVAWQTGVLVSEVLDIVENKGIRTAIVDVSFTAHMPDTLEMPYRPRITGATDPVPGKPSYRIGGVSCLAGDFMYEYSFEEPLQVGQKLIFEDMMHYTMVKTTMFNGVEHPRIAVWRPDGTLEVIREFVFEDFKGRLS